VQADAITRTLYANQRLLAGEFWCAPDSTRWHSLNSVSPEAHVIFPRTPVTIRQLGRDPVMCDRNQIVFYNPGQQFFRTLRTTAGDHCYYVELSSQLMIRLAGGMGAFPFAFGPCDAPVFLLQRLAVRHLLDPHPDERLADEALTVAVESAIEGARIFHGLRARLREATRAAHREIVDQTKQLLVARYRDRLTMSEIAASLAISRFQLSRIFRERTGFSLLGYRNQLRVRAAFDRLSDPNVRLSALAGELGYSNPSHLTAAFRDAFGFLPSELRGPIDRKTLSDVLARHSPTTNVRLSAATGPS
jgi:AraC family transcriptional regulator of adaptative response / methylphosphotriester-DNA alkyltransferase methyltransferase